MRRKKPTEHKEERNKNDKGEETKTWKYIEKKRKKIKREKEVDITGRNWWNRLEQEENRLYKKKNEGIISKTRIFYEEGNILKKLLNQCGQIM